jgi:hypothetical protein
MNQQEHVGMAQELTERAEEEARNGGNELVAAEFLWGAFAHCLITIALNEGLPRDSHGAFQAIARYLDAALGGNVWRSRFGAAEGLHSHFYHGNLTEDQLRTHKQATVEGAQELLRMLRTGD